MAIKVAVVTGANRGLGLEIVRQLCGMFQGHVYLTCRMTEKGKKAIEDLKKENLTPYFHELDISKPDSIRMFEGYIKKTYGGLDILINNAGFTYGKQEDVPLVKQAELSVGTDFTGTLNVCQILLPYLRPHGRVVIITNGYIGRQADLGENIKKNLDLKKVSLHELSVLMDKFMKSVENGTQKNDGWPESPSKVAKTFESFLAAVLARQSQHDKRENILINACCPGWTQSGGSDLYTDENGLCDGVQPKPVSEAAQGVVWLATLKAGTEDPNGQVVRYLKTIGF